MAKADEAYREQGITKAGHTALWWATKAGETFRGSMAKAGQTILGEVAKADEAYREGE